MEAQFIAIVKDPIMTEMMQRFDVFDKGKVVANIQKLNVDFKKETVVDEKKINETIDNLVKTFKEVKKPIAFITLYSKLINHIPYFDPTVRQVSNGKKFFMLHEWISHLGYKVETTNDMYVKSIKL